MKVIQIYEIVNSAVKEVLGETALVQEDLSNIVDVGKQVFDAEKVDNYVRKLVNHIGKVVFVNRLYAGGVPSVLMDSWEFGSVLQKISGDLPEAHENQSWELEDGKDYSADTFYKPSVSAKFFNSKVTFEVAVSFTEMQVKESFSNAEQLNGFLSMLTTNIENAMTVKLDALIMRTINNFTAETLVTEIGDLNKMGDNTTVKAVNLLKMFNDAHDSALSSKDALTSSDFIRFATYQIGLYSDRMSKISKLFNMGGKERFTPKDLQHTVLLSDFALASETFLKSITFNPENVTLPKHETVPFWQGSGLDYSFNEVSAIKAKTTSGADVDVSGIIGVMFDRDAVGVSNLDRRVTTNYNPKAEFYTNFYKFDAGYYNDFNENFIVFFIADGV